MVASRLFADVSDENLPTGGGGPALLAIKIVCGFGIDPASQTGGTQVIGLVAVHRIVFREIRQACGILSGDCRCGPQASEQCDGRDFHGFGVAGLSSRGANGPQISDIRA